MSHDEERHAGPVDAGRRGLIAGAAFVTVATGAAALRPGSASARSGGGQGTLRAPAPLDGPANPEGRFAGKVAIVTGATSGIGRTTAEAFAREGARVAFCGRREALGGEVERGIRAFGGEAVFVRADVRDDAQVRRFVDAAAERWGRLDIAFNNAGYFMEPERSPRLVPAPAHEMSDEHWATIMDTNAGGVFRAVRAEVPYMLRNPDGATIINMASVSGHAAFPGMSGYAASKHAVIGFTKVVAAELAERNIRVVSVSPLAVDTPMIRASMRHFGMTMEQAAATLPLKRQNTTDEIARAVMFLASADATSLAGMDLDVTGGYLAR